MSDLYTIKIIMPRGVYVRSNELKEKLRNNFGNKEGFSFWEGKSRSEETKEKLRQARIGKKANDDTKNKMKIARIGKVSGMKGKKHSEETRSKISLSLQGEKCYKWKGGVSDENMYHSLYVLGNIKLLKGSSNSKKINQYTLDGTFIKTWDSIKNASDELGLKQNALWYCVTHKKIKVLGGFVWEIYNNKK